ncbi:TIGR03435 family protein [Granulicella mallensis]|nr:TIGR03435 family protein [Granulicella mallensis]
MIVSRGFSRSLSKCQLILAGFLLVSVSNGFGQASRAQAPTTLHTKTSVSQTTAFEVATVRPSKDGTSVGVRVVPSGKVYIGFATLKALILEAFNIRPFQVVGGPSWLEADRYDVVALPPATSERGDMGKASTRMTLNDEERKMLQTLLVERFGLRFHREITTGPIFVLVRGTKTLQMKEAKEDDLRTRGFHVSMSGGYEEFGTHISIASLVQEVSSTLERPVVDQTGLKRFYNFTVEMPPSDHDEALATTNLMQQLGLKLKTAKGQVETIRIENASKPTMN